MKNKKVERVFTVVGYLLIAALALLLVFVIVSNATGHTVFVFGYTTAWVMTDSMEPTIPARSYVVLKESDPAEIKEGDVIMFRSDDPDLNGAFNMHRVVEVKGNELVTKGDHNPTADNYTAKLDKVVGVYVKNLPTLTAIGRFMSSGIGKVIVITLILVILMGIYLPGIIKATRRKSEELERLRKEQIDRRIKEEVEKLMRANRPVSSADEHAEQSLIPPEQTPEEAPAKSPEEGQTVVPEEPVLMPFEEQPEEISERQPTEATEEKRTRRIPHDRRAGAQIARRNGLRRRRRNIRQYYKNNLRRLRRATPRTSKNDDR